MATLPHSQWRVKATLGVEPAAKEDDGLTVVMITHDEDVAQFARRVIVFRDGTIRKDEPVLDQPRASAMLRDMPMIED